QVVEKAFAAWARAVIRGKARRVRELRLERCAAAAIRQDLTDPVILHEDADDEVEVSAFGRCRQDEQRRGTPRATWNRKGRKAEEDGDRASCDAQYHVLEPSPFHRLRKGFVSRTLELTVRPPDSPLVPRMIASSEPSGSPAPPARFEIAGSVPAEWSAARKRP